MSKWDYMGFQTKLPSLQRVLPFWLSYIHYFIYPFSQTNSGVYKQAPREHEGYIHKILMD